MADDKTLVERLRAAADDGELNGDTFEQAADRLRAQIPASTDPERLERMARAEERRNQEQGLKRIQLSRKRGWRMPAGAVKVDRSTPWGNPYQAGNDGDGDRQKLVNLFRAHLDRPENAVLRERGIASLRGKTLACWCALEGPCHADVWLEIVNR